MGDYSYCLCSIGEHKIVNMQNTIYCALNDFLPIPQGHELQSMPLLCCNITGMLKLLSEPTWTHDTMLACCHHLSLGLKKSKHDSH